MHILLFNPCKIPALLYGGTERVMWDLGYTLTQMGHKVTFLVNKGSYCAFADVLFYDDSKDINKQIPDGVDVVHCQSIPPQAVKKPYLITIHGNPSFGHLLDKQCVFVSQNHAQRYNSTAFVHNGLDWGNYPIPDLTAKKNYFHFLANAAWKVKNIKGAISITKKAKEKLVVLGGYRLNLKMGPRFTFDTHVSFKGMVNNQQKSVFMQNSKGLIFPVLWNEPFGLAVVESLYFGCPVFATPYGSLPELVKNDVGFLSSKTDDLVEAIKNAASFENQKCHKYALENFSAQVMANNYLKYYERVLNNEVLNNQLPTLFKQATQKYLALD
ncbi:MAG: glycosyltransferase family 4 protein [Sphingobacteriales bacterium]|nr:MAG: glycosyltransferase family 4 protein [Sphingobacteriales bacterium]